MQSPKDELTEIKTTLLAIGDYHQRSKIYAIITKIVEILKKEPSDDDVKQIESQLKTLKENTQTIYRALKPQAKHKDSLYTKTYGPVCAVNPIIIENNYYLMRHEKLSYCMNPECKKHNTLEHNTKKCGTCGTTFCSAECFSKEWKSPGSTHKKICKLFEFDKKFDEIVMETPSLMCSGKDKQSISIRGMNRQIMELENLLYDKVEMLRNPEIAKLNDLHFHGLLKIGKYENLLQCISSEKMRIMGRVVEKSLEQGDFAINDQDGKIKEKYEKDKKKSGIIRKYQKQ